MTRALTVAVPLLVAGLIGLVLWQLFAPAPHPDSHQVPAPTTTAPAPRRQEATPTPSPAGTARPDLVRTASPDATPTGADPGADLDQDTSADEQEQQQELARAFVGAFLDTASPRWLEQLREVPLTTVLSTDLQDVDPGNIRPAEVIAVQVADSSAVRALIDVTITGGTIRVELAPGGNGWEVGGYELNYT